ncbi:MAG: hypothetical protein C4560_01450, partial [Nitrospiraceae bacterium]
VGSEAVYPVEIKYANTQPCGEGGSKMCGGHYDGYYGYRYQLDPAFNCDTFSSLPGNRVVCKALQEYGMIFVENTGPGGISLYFEDLDNQPDKSWAGLVSNKAGSIPTNRFIRVVDPIYPAGYQYKPQCSDGEDNEADGLTDYPDDPKCLSASDNDEYN